MFAGYRMSDWCVFSQDVIASFQEKLVRVVSGEKSAITLSSVPLHKTWIFLFPVFFWWPWL